MSEPDGDPPAEVRFPARVSPPRARLVRHPPSAFGTGRGRPIDPPRRTPTDPPSARAPRPPLVFAPRPHPPVSRRSPPLPLHPQDASPPPPPTPPDFDLDWRALAVVIEAGSQGVDATAVQTALLSAPDEHVHDGRSIVFGALSFEELQRDAADAEEGTPLHSVHASILADQESHAASEDPDKGEWSVPLPLRAELFHARARVDAAAYKAELTAKRQAAVAAAKEAEAEAAERVESARAAVEEASAAVAEARRVALDAGEPWPPEVPDGEDEPPDPVEEAEEALAAAKEALRAAKGATRDAEGETTKPRRATKVYALADDLRGEDADALAALAAAGFPARAVLNVARARWTPKRDASDGADGGDGNAASDAAAADPEEPEEDDPYPPFCDSLLTSRAAAVTARDFAHPSRGVAVVPVSFPRDEPVPDASTLASLAADACGALALSDMSYVAWRESATIVHVPDAAGVTFEDVDTRTYAQLLAGVPHERATCATVLDAIVGQVCASALDAEDVRRASDIAAAEAARAAVAEALFQTKLDAIPERREGDPNGGNFGFGFGTGAGAGTFDTLSDSGSETCDTLTRRGGVTLVQEGDAASTLRATRGAGSLAATLEGKPVASVVKLDPDESELRMARLASTAIPGADRLHMPEEPEMDDDRCGARKTSLATYLPSPDVPLQVMERRELMNAAAALLPPGVDDDHADELRTRRHWEPLTREAYASIYASARDDLPCARRAYHAPEDALITVLHAGPHEETTTTALNRALAWSEYHDEYRAALARRREAERLARLAEEEAARSAEEAEYARLAAEESSLAALSPTARRAREEANAAAAEEARRLAEEDAARREAEEEAARAAEQEEAADWAWDGSDASELEAERLAAEEAANAPPPLVPMPSTAYDVEAATGTLVGVFTRVYAPNGAVVTVGSDGAPTVSFGGARVGMRGATVVATFGSDPGASIVVARAPADPDPEPEYEPELDDDGNPALDEDGNPKFKPELDDDGNPVLDEDGNPKWMVKKTGAAPVPVLDEEGNPVLDDAGEPTYEAAPEPPPPPRKPVFAQHTASSGLCVAVTTQRRVVQRVAARGPDAAERGAAYATVRVRSSSTAEETSRAVFPDGSTARYLSDGATEILHPNGNVSRRDADGTAWEGTNDAGARWSQGDPYEYVPEHVPELDEEGNPALDENGNPKFKPELDEEGNPALDENGNPKWMVKKTGLDPEPQPGDVLTPPPRRLDRAGSATTTDPETGAEVTSRGDLTLVVRHPDFLRGGPEKGKFLAVHADGTRVCMDPDAGCAWRVEREGMASVHAPRGGGALAVDLGDAAAAAEEDGVVVVVAPDGGVIAANEEGRVAFCPGTVQNAAEVAKAALAGDAFGAFVFDLERRALRFDDGTRREEEKDEEENAAADAVAVGARLSSAEASRVSVASRASAADEPREEPEPTPGAFIVHDGKILSLREFEDLDPPPPPPQDGDDENGEDDAEENEENADEDEKAEEKVEEIAADEIAADEIASAAAADASLGPEASASDPGPPPPPPIVAPLVSPRMFVVYPDQECYFEVLSERAFEAYAASRRSDPTCTVSRAPVAGPEPDVTNHTFLTPTTAPARPRAPAHVPAASPRPPRPSSANPSMPALRLPSRPTFPSAPSALVLPRVAAMRPPPPAPPPPPDAFAFRQVVEYPALGRDLAAKLDAALARQAAQYDEDAAVTPAMYLLNDLRGDVVRLAESNLADRIVAARRDKEAAYAERARAEAEAAEAAELEEAERDLAEGMAAMAAEIRRAPIGQSPRRRDPPVFPPCNFFAAEEGTRTLDLLRTLPTRPTLPRRPEPTLPDPVKLADPEPSDPRDDFLRLRGGRGGDYSVDVTRSHSHHPHLSSSRRRVRSDPSDGFSAAQREAFARTYPTRVSGYASSRVADETEDVYYAEDHHLAGLSHASPRREPSAGAGAPRRGDPSRVGPDTRRDRFLGGTRPAAAPARYYREKAESARNARYDDVEGNARRPLRTTSTGSRASRDRGAQFELSPAHVHFGRVPVGSTTARVALLTNVSPDLGRFSLRQPDPDGPFRVKFAPGLVSPGLAAKLKVTCAATRPGEYVDEVIITTERQVFALSLSARVAGLDDAENAGGAGGGETSERFRAEDDVVAVRLDPNLTLDELRERARFGGGR